MKNTALIVFILTIFLAPVKSEISPTFFAEGQQLFVVAYSGLNLRETPDNNASAILTIPYGKIVTVLPFDQICVTIQEIDYARGSWVKVNFEGQTGYVFDGFLSPLAVPQYHAEITHGSVSIFSLLENWVDIHLIPSDNSDTTINEASNKIIHFFEGGETMEKQIFHNAYRTQLLLSGVRLMDVFHLIKGFYHGTDQKEELDQNTIFIKDDEGNLKTIKINLGHNCEIRQMKNGQIKLTIQKSYSGC